MPAGRCSAPRTSPTQTPTTRPPARRAAPPPPPTPPGESSRALMAGAGTRCEELGFYYVGPIDGHNLDHLLPVLKNVRDAETGPILVHVVTEKGHGYAPAQASDDRYHGVVKFDITTGKKAKAKSNAHSYTKVFGEILI